MKTLPLLLLVVSLAACGNLKKSADAKGGNANNGNGGGVTNHLSDHDRATACGKLSGIVVPKGAHTSCLVETKKSIRNDQADDVVITSSCQEGDFVVSRAPQSGGALVMQDVTDLGDANGLRKEIYGACGSISFHIQDSNYSEASAIVYRCFDEDVKPVACSDDRVP